MSVALWGSLTPRQPNGAPYASHQAQAASNPPPESRADVATEIVAHYTRMLAWVTGILTVIGAVQGALFVMQLLTTRAQLRAYVFLQSAGITDGRDKPGLPWSRVEIKNTGATPAYDVRHWSRIVYCAVGTDTTYVPPEDIRDLVPTSTGPGGALSAESNLGRVLEQAEIDTLAIFPPTHMLCVYGKTTYRDIFGRNRETTYRLGWAGIYPPPKGVELVHTKGGSRAT